MWRKSYIWSLFTEHIKNHSIWINVGTDMPRNIPNKSAYLYYTLFFWLWHRAILQSNHQCFYFSPLGSEQPDCSSFFFGRQPPVGQGLLIHEVSRSHTTTQHSRQDSSGQVISSSQRPLPDNTQHSQQTNIHARGRIRNHNLSRRAAADLRLWPRGQCDRHISLHTAYIVSQKTDFDP